jgi:GNAT superfamily N-acetyltransferase
MISAIATIRTASTEDAPRIHAIHTAAVRTLCAICYPAEIIDGWLLNRTPSNCLPSIERRAIFVAEVKQEIVGFGEASPGSVVAVYVDPAAIGKGVGRIILTHALELAHRGRSGPIRVESTLNASSFYQHHGLVEVQRSSVKRNHVGVPIVVMEQRVALYIKN